MSQPNEKPLDIYSEVKAVLGGLAEFLPEPPKGSIPPMPESVRQFALAQGRAAWEAVNGTPIVLLECRNLPTPLVWQQYSGIGNQGRYVIAQHGDYCEMMYREIVTANGENRLYCNGMLLADALAQKRNLMLQATVYLPIAARHEFPVTSYTLRLTQAMTSVLMLQDGHDGLITCGHTVLRHTDTVPCHADVTLFLLGEV